jgi:hypothetical protein
MVFLVWASVYWHDFATGLFSADVFVILALRWLLGLLLVWDMYTYELHVPAWFISISLSVAYGLFLLV